MDGSLITTGLVVATGCGLFLRLVAKEKHRREKYLQMRMEEKIKEQEAREKAEADAANQPTKDAQPITTIQPVDSDLQAA